MNLGVGVYSDDNGKIPLLAAVKAAEKARLEAMPPRGYQPIEGAQAYDSAVQNLLFGADSELIKAGQVVTAQALGGTGALKIGADFLKRLNPVAKVYISNPSWENHRALFESAGFEVENYPYYDAATRGVDFDGMRAFLAQLPAGSIIVLHACCHNPTGADLSDAQWAEVVQVCRERGLVPFLDMAYQGFADGIDADAVAVRCSRPPACSSSCPAPSPRASRCTASASAPCPSSPPARKNPRGCCRSSSALSAPTTPTRRFMAARWWQRCCPIRNCAKCGKTNWPACATVSARCAPAWWRRSRPKAWPRTSPSSPSSAACSPYTGLSAAQVERLRAEFGIYAVSTGRICLAALNSKNLGYVASAIAQVVKAD